MTTMIFPYAGPEAEAYAEAATERGEEVLRIYPDMLPSIHSNLFAGAFETMGAYFQPTHIYCPAASVYHFMRNLIVERNLPIKLIGKSPIQKAMDEHRKLMKRAEELQPLAKMPAVELAGILKIAMNIYGESSDEKLAAMIGVFDDAPKEGNIVEIGCLAGRTAFVLGLMAARSGINSLLTIDPWAADAGVQSDSPQLLTELTNEWDWDTLAEMFDVNTAVRLSYHAHARCSSSDAGVDPSQLEISVIHIDGNHDYAAAKSDCDRFASRILPGGWLILDDYEWAHGDGPRRAGDELLQDRADEIDHYGVVCKALFVKFKGV